MLVGDKGILTCAGWSGMPRLLPMELHRAYKRPAKTLPRVAGHHADWLQACKGGTPACSNFDYGARLTEFVLLGALALRTGKVLKWDAANMKVTNNVPEAQAIIDGSYRKGWEVRVATSRPRQRPITNVQRPRHAQLPTPKAQRSGHSRATSERRSARTRGRERLGVGRWECLGRW